MMRNTWSWNPGIYGDAVNQQRLPAAAKICTEEADRHMKSFMMKRYRTRVDLI
jgi:hypothetical protein